MANDGPALIAVLGPDRAGLFAEFGDLKRLDCALMLAAGRLRRDAT